MWNKYMAWDQIFYKQMGKSFDPPIDQGSVREQSRGDAAAGAASFFGEQTEPLSVDMIQVWSNIDLN